MINVSNLRQSFRNQELNELKEVKNAIQNGDPTEDDNILIRSASARGNTEAVRLLLEDRRADPTADDNYAIIEASKNGRTEVVRLLLRDGRADPTADDNIIIGTASFSGRTEIVRLLLEDGRADPRADNNIAIITASRKGHTEVVRLLLEDGRADPRANNNEAIQMASENGHTEIVRMLLQDGRVNPRANDKYAIKMASNRGHTEVLLLLLEWYGNNSVPFERIYYIIRDRYRKYILMYYDLNEIPLNMYDFNITENEEDQEFVEYMLTNLAYDTKRRERFLELINPVGYNLRGAGIPVRGVRDIISEYAGINPEVKTNYEISQTLDDIGIPPELTSLIGSLLIGQRRSDTGLDAVERAGAETGSEYSDTDSD
jgi:ankyrin repeat protein